MKIVIHNNIYYLDYCSFIVCLGIRKYDSFKFVLCQTCFDSSVLAFLLKFENKLVNFYFKKSCQDFDRNCVESIDQLREN